MRLRDWNCCWKCARYECLLRMYSHEVTMIIIVFLALPTFILCCIVRERKIFLALNSLKRHLIEISADKSGLKDTLFLRRIPLRWCEEKIQIERKLMENHWYGVDNTREYEIVQCVLWCFLFFVSLLFHTLLIQSNPKCNIIGCESSSTNQKWRTNTWDEKKKANVVYFIQDAHRTYTSLSLKSEKKQQQQRPSPLPPQKYCLLRPQYHHHNHISSNFSNTSSNGIKQTIYKRYKCV